MHWYSRYDKKHRNWTNHSLVVCVRTNLLLQIQATFFLYACWAVLVITAQKRKEQVAAYSLWCWIILSAFIMVPVPAYSQYLKCPNCGSQVASFSNYCNFCGVPLRQPILLKICPRCKTRIPATSNFCPECGQKQQCCNNRQNSIYGAGGKPRLALSRSPSS